MSGSKPRNIFDAYENVGPPLADYGASNLPFCVSISFGRSMS